MQKNVGGLDRTARLVLGPILLVIALAALVGVVTVEFWLALLLLVVGAVFTATGVTQRCVLNRLLGLDTS